MKIAFVGKGGSGKSTITSLFINFLREKKKNILAIDADINMNLAGLLGVAADTDLLLSNPHNALKIRTLLKGSNTRIHSPHAFLPTTPPANGSNIITSFTHDIIKTYGQSITDDALYLMTVGTYKKEGIGQSCYHSDLFVAENILSHSFPKKDDWIVCDMVAGTDAFAYSLHLQFDAIILIAEPTLESIEVCKLYMDLAKEAGTEKIIHILGNKIEDEDDLAFIHEQLGMKPLAFIPAMRSLKKLRQNARPIQELEMTSDIVTAMGHIKNATINTEMGERERLPLLHALHRKLSQKEWVKAGYGEVHDQIDPDFTLDDIIFHEAA